LKTPVFRILMRIGPGGSGPTTCRKSIHHVSGENELQGRETRPFQKPFHYVCVTIMQHKVRNLHLLCTPAPAPQLARGESEMQTRPGLTRLLLDRNLTHLAIASDGRQKGKQGAVPSLFATGFVIGQRGFVQAPDACSESGCLRLLEFLANKRRWISQRRQGPVSRRQRRRWPREAFSPSSSFPTILQPSCAPQNSHGNPDRADGNRFGWSGLGPK
jgi:hypothetical protein